MGALITKPAKEEGNGSAEGGDQTKQAKKQILAVRHFGVDNTPSSADVPVKRKTLKEQQKECPPGFRKFALDWNQSTRISLCSCGRMSTDRKILFINLVSWCGLKRL